MWTRAMGARWRPFVLLTTIVLGAPAAAPCRAQDAGVRVFPSTPVDPDAPRIVAAVQELRDAGALLDRAAVVAQLDRSSCTLELPPPRTTPLEGRALWQAARQSYLRVGWYRLCPRCEDWHLGLSGGYVLTTDGAVATCAHVIRPDPKTIRDGYLVAADDDGQVYPVVEILALNDRADVAIIRIRAEGLTPLPLNTDVAPGDDVWCYSEPLQRRGYFSRGIVNRVIARGRAGAPDAPLALNVSADWAPGSSGSALLDRFGNAIGHVSRISALFDQEDDPARRHGPYLILHEAIAAREVQRLVVPAP